MRSRSYGPDSKGDTSTYAEFFADQWNYSNGQWSLAGSQTVPYSGTMPNGHIEGTMQDIVTPNFAHIRDSGGIVNSPMNQTRTESWCEAVRIYAAAKYQSATRMSNQSVNGTFDPNYFDMRANGDTVVVNDVPYIAEFSESEINQLIKETVTEAWAACANAPLSAWVLVGEFNETLQTLAWLLKQVRLVLETVFQGLPKSVRSYWNRRRREGYSLRRLKTDVGAIANFWLQLRYGLRPLIYDICGALKALQYYDEKVRQRFHASGELSEKSASSDAVPEGVGCVTFDVQTTRTLKCSVRAGVLVEPAFETENLLTLLGTGEVIKGMWDLLPYSFVIDWFTNVGSILSSWSPSAYVKPLASWAVIELIDERIRTIPEESVAVPGSYLGWPLVEGFHSVTVGHAHEVHKTKWRIPEPPRAVIPTFKLKMAVTNAVDLLALVTNIGKFRY